MPVNPTKQDNIEKEYDEAPYTSYPYYQTHPTHLYTLAKLFGIKATPVETARVLELGCASGGNLIPMALHFPKAQFIGIDLSRKELEDGINTINDLKLQNIKMIHQSILDFDIKHGNFDYIICHGVYSWVDKDVRDKIFDVIQKHLSTNGIAFVSYNVFPGWNSVNTIKDLMKWHIQGIKDPFIRVKKARAILEMYVNGFKGEKDFYADFFESELKSINMHNDYYLIHEHLSTINHPVYFTQFMEDANKHKLVYLCDSYISHEYIDILSQNFAKELNQIEDVNVIGQHIDFIRNNRFRCSLLCHESQPIDRSMRSRKIEDYYLELSSEPDKPDITEEEIQNNHSLTIFTKISHLKVGNPISQMLILILIREKYKPITFDDLCKKISEKVKYKTYDEIKSFVKNNLNLIDVAFAGLIKLTCYPGDHILEITEKPIACPLARYQALKQNFTTNRQHKRVELDVVSRVILPHLDGSKDRNEICKIIRSHVDLATLQILDDKNNIIDDQEEIERKVQSCYDFSLAQLSRFGLLIG